jgi:Fe-Mn family superoxide dismutase
MADIRTILNRFDYITEAKQTYVQAKLPYKRTDLAPVTSKETLDYHYGTLHKAYVDKANAGKGGDFQIAGAFLHNLYFSQFKKPGGVNNPTGSSLELIERVHGSYATFKEKFTNIAMDIQGSGWAYMDTKGNIKTIINHKVVNNIAILVDWWEHAWALDYQADKGKYLNNIWKIVNWNIVDDRVSSVT